MSVSYADVSSFFLFLFYLRLNGTLSTLPGNTWLKHTFVRFNTRIYGLLFSFLFLNQKLNSSTSRFYNAPRRYLLSVSVLDHLPFIMATSGGRNRTLQAKS